MKTHWVFAAVGLQISGKCRCSLRNDRQARFDQHFGNHDRRLLDNFGDGIPFASVTSTQ